MPPPSIRPAGRAAFDSDGIVVKRDFLPPETFAALKAELYGRDFEAFEIRQGCAAERLIPLTEPLMRKTPYTCALVADPRFRGLTHYAASRAGQPI